MPLPGLQVLREAAGGLMRGKETPVILELEESLRAKGDMTRDEELKISVSKAIVTVSKAFTTATSSIVVYYSLGVGPKLFGNPPLPRVPRICMAAGSAWLCGKLMYYTALQASSEYILKGGEERMKMELANMWRLRHTYVDHSFMERVKEIEVNSSDEGSGSISGQRTTNIGSFGDLMEDPLACILGSPDGNTESSKFAEDRGTIVTRREVQAHRRSYRHHRRHAHKASVV
ncbi:uncharacterized protein LOC102716447 isoform X3 [Oryza brachyantha]|uniref:uncharacterized protein LOC102716447 isoform X3 n=1 Tax=Oryza brachyantha TaxID=4533 RepID=UPI001ADCD7DE|nr:uncharacterized protein LOC102716447 isoform X3 [Oryza brachyantha]